MFEYFFYVSVWNNGYVLTDCSCGQSWKELQERWDVTYKQRRSNRMGYMGTDPTNFWESNMDPPNIV